jgi:hypothetical protein
MVFAVNVPLLVGEQFKVAIVPCVAVPHNSFQIDPVNMLIQFVVVLKTTNPAAGEAMASRSTVVIRGIKSPLLVDVTSKIAEAFGVSVPIPTCACNDIEHKTNKKGKINFFIFLWVYLLFLEIYYCPK